MMFYFFILLILFNFYFILVSTIAWRLANREFRMTRPHHMWVLNVQCSMRSMSVFEVYHG